MMQDDSTELRTGRRRMCRVCGDLHWTDRWPDNHREAAPQRSDHPAPYIQSDKLGRGVNGLWHPIENRMIDSKSQFREVTRKHGCREIGNERLQDSASFRNYEPPVNEKDVFNDVCKTMAEHDIRPSDLV